MRVVCDWLCDGVWCVFLFVSVCACVAVGVLFVVYCVVLYGVCCL